MLIGISGASCSGKTTLARQMSECLKSPIFHLDQHFIEEAPRPIVNGLPSFEQPHQYDGTALLDEVVEAIDSHEHLVVEGFLLFTYPGFTSICDQMIHIDVPHEVLAQRRELRRQGEGASDVNGGRIPAADDAWSKHGREEWLRYGDLQSRIPGVQVVRPGETHPSCPAAICSTLLKSWGMELDKAA